MAIGPRTYRVRVPNISFTLDVVAFEGTTEVARARIALPDFYDADRASIAQEGSELVVSFVAWHCKESTAREGTLRLDGSCHVLWKSW